MVFFFLKLVVLIVWLSWLSLMSYLGVDDVPNSLNFLSSSANIPSRTARMSLDCRDTNVQLFPKNAAALTVVISVVHTSGPSLFRSEYSFWFGPFTGLGDTLTFLSSDSLSLDTRLVTRPSSQMHIQMLDKITFSI